MYKRQPGCGYSAHGPKEKMPLNTTALRICARRTGLAPRDIIARLLSLECGFNERFARMLRIALICLLCFASSLLGSAVTVLVLTRTTPAPAAEPEPEPDRGTITAHEIVLTNQAGRTRVRLQGETHAGAPGGQIVLYDDVDVPRMTLAMRAEGPEITMLSSELPDPDHKRIRIAVDGRTARIDVGHGELEEIVLKSGMQTDPPANVIEVNARNGSTAALLTDTFGHATLEVTDLTTKSIFRSPEAKPLLP